MSFSPLIQPAIDRGVLPGAVTLVANRDGILSLEAHGVADLATGQPMTPDTQFWIASQTKPITGTLLAMLMEAGRIDADDPVEKYLPEFQGQMVLAEEDAMHRLLRAPAHPITIRNVLTHTSGMPFASPVETPSYDLLPLATAVRSYPGLPLQFEPDTRYLYSNAGINTAARVIEVVTGQSYVDFLHARLLGPLGLREMTFWPDAAQARRLAKTYWQKAAGEPLEERPLGQLHHADLTDRVHRHPMPAGGLFSTAADCGRFCQMIARGGELDGRRYLSEAAVTTMTTKQTPAPVENAYGWGWGIDDGLPGHNGANATSMHLDRRTGLVLVFLVQRTGFCDEVAELRKQFQQSALARFGGA